MNAAVLVYGQTGSGKTFTMEGPDQFSEVDGEGNRGVLQRAFEYLFTRWDWPWYLTNTFLANFGVLYLLIQEDLEDQ